MREPVGTATAELIVRKSRFIGYGMPVADTAAVSVALGDIRKKHPDSSHVVHAALVGAPHAEIASLSDAGEPRGTAGRPVMDILKGSGVRNVLIAVVRYFGGTKLGTGGLVRAYGDTAREVLAELRTRELLIRDRLGIRLSYAIHEPVRRLLAERGVEISEERFGTDVTLEVNIARNQLEDIKAAIRDLTGGTAVISNQPE